MSSLRLAFAGTPDFAAQHLEALLETEHTLVGVLTQPDRRSGRGKRSQPSPVKSLALSADLPVLQPATLRDETALSELRTLELDALIVVAYGLILPEAALAIPRYGCINVHGSLLPRWRGAAPIQRAVEAGDSESGITIMQMDAGLDTGPMLKRGSCPIPPLASSGELYARLAELGPRLLREVLEDLPGHLARAEAQDDSDATYASKIDKREAQLNWSAPATVLARRVRAFNPAPGAYTVLDGQRIKVWDAQPMPGVAASPGTIVAGENGLVHVACSEGVLALTHLQLPGARAMSAEDVLRGHSDLFSVGSTFDSPERD